MPDVQAVLCVFMLLIYMKTALWRPVFLTECRGFAEAGHRFFDV
jgi:hypothetical protein